MDIPDDKLKAVREQIDAIDRELLDLFNRRAELAIEVAEIKSLSGTTNGYYRPDREAEVRTKMAQLNHGPLADEEVSRLFQEIMSACRALEQAMQVAFLGPEGTFTEAAVHRHFGSSVQTRSLNTIDAVFREVESGACGYGVVPVENSTEGVINHTLDSFMQSALVICGEVELRIHHCLMTRAESLERIESFTRTSNRWLSAGDGSIPISPQWRLKRSTVTPMRARRAAGEPGSAAVAGKVAAEAYDLGILASNIEDDPNNTTRFLVIGREPVELSGSDKTSMLLSAKNQPGALYDLLEPLSRRSISMTRIESRPSRMQLWEYVFFVDFEGHVDDPNVAAALTEMAEHASLFKVLGSYPRVTV